LLASCANWPAYRASAPRSVPWDSDLSALVAASWTSAEEAPEADPPFAQPTQATLARGEGVVVGGTLQGAGSNLAETPVLEQAGCPNSPALLYPLPPGAYLGDVDVIHLTVEDEGLLCVDARFGAELSVGEELGVDAWAAALDPCGLPGAPLGDPESPLGVGLGGQVRWQLPVSPGALALVQAAFLPDDPTLLVEWSTRVALVGYREGDDVLCPPPPESK
jgi:hypothetical protein